MNLTYAQAPAEYEPQPGDQSVFLAGGIPFVKRWRPAAMEMLWARGRDLFPRLVIVDPEQPEKPADGKAQVAWEHRHLRLVDVGLFWFPASDAAVVQPSTIWELAQAVSEQRPIAIGADPGYSRRDILENQLAMYPNLVLFDQLPATVDEAVRLLAVTR